MKIAKCANFAFFALFPLLLCFFSGCGTLENKAQESVGSKVSKVSFESKALGKTMRFNIYLPKGYSKKIHYPVLYLIHGYTDTEDAWMPNLNLKDAADRLVENGKIASLIIVMPQIDNSFGINTDKIMNMSLKFSAGMYEDYLYKDLIPYIDKKYSTVKSKAGRYIGGLSMGGFAALHLAFCHPDMFSKVGGHSPAFADDPWLYPNDEKRNERDPIKIASSKDLGSLKVYLDCGDRDSFKFYVGCEQLFAVLQSRGISSEYHLNSGEHNAEYWKAHSDDYLVFYAGKS